MANPPTVEPSAPPATLRFQPLDALRGLVMVIMALDHVRDFFHSAAMSFQPDDLTRTTTALFFTRWITHICAPVFAFAAGVGAFLWLNRGRDVRQLSHFLWKRGLWLVLLDLVVVRFAMFFSLTSGPVILNVLWSLGWSMVALGFLVRFPVPLVGAFSGAVILLHNVADPVSASDFGAAAWLWNVLMETGVVLLNGVPVITAYPVVPWMAVMAAGFCFGHLLVWSPDQRRTWLLRIGLGMIAAFILLRLWNVYGDPRPWSTQSTPALTFLSFLRTTKYPPSLQFLLMTLGPAMLLWAGLERLRLGRHHPLIVFGRVPLFYFLLHLYVIHALTYLFAIIRYGTVGFLTNPLPSLGGNQAAYPPDFGYDLLVVYAVWLLVLALMYPACRFFSQLKERRRDPWLSYL